MDLLTLLAGDLLAWLRQKPDGAPRRVLLWLDPQREFGRLIPTSRLHLSEKARGCWLWLRSRERANLPSSSNC